MISMCERVRTRVMVVDDHRIVREGLSVLLGTQPDMEIVGEAEDGEEALEAARRLHPDVVIMDINMPRVSGVEATRRIKREMPSVGIVALSMHGEEEIVAAMRSAGADSYVAKGGPADELWAAIRSLGCRTSDDHN